MKNKTTYTASEARKNFYSLIKEANKGLTQIEINLRGNDPVVLMSKKELESIEETIEVLAIPGARKSILRGLREDKSSLISHEKLVEEFGLDE